ncbi:MAG: ABC transporter ATP-binding protein [Balneolales bacterium]|nr:ABC transporter ATP-binding protein [Balneolales bacterium]
MIELKNIEKGYRNPETGSYESVIQIPQLTIGAKDHIAIAGPSGTGKTTLLHLLSGLISPDKGSIVLNGTDITSLSESGRDRFRADNIGYIFQSFNLLDGYTALENVMLGMTFTGKGSDKAKATETLKSLGLAERLHYKPSELSTGQQQRVCIARAIVNNPKIILADEPTGNLDPATTREILAILKENAKDKILIIVTHESEVLDQFENHLDLLKFKPQEQLS